MDTFLTAMPVIFIGILMVSFIDAVGSVLSRKLRFNYSYLSILSFTAYTLMGYWTSKITGNLIYAMAIPAIVGIYDSTVGWWLSVRLKAYWGNFKEEDLKMSTLGMILLMLPVSCVFGFIGHSLA